MLIKQFITASLIISMISISFGYTIRINAAPLSPKKNISERLSFPKGTSTVSIPNVRGVRAHLLKNISTIVKKSISEGNYPGAIILAAHRGQLIYKGVFGNRRIVPNVAPMRFNTIFDVASLTKVVVTTPAIMQLVEKGKIDLDDPVAKYWPAFALNGKERVTIRELLTHTSGLPADITVVPPEDAIHQIQQLKLSYSPGTAFVYSDVNFIVLAHLVKVITGERIDQYAKKHIFKPLRMKKTFFLPPSNLCNDIAPTEIVDDKLRWGQVHDPTAYSMEGIAGNAGLFSTANDLSIYAQSLLNGGRIPHLSSKQKNSHFLGPLTILKMITPQTPSNMLSIRGLGWDIDSSFSNRGVLFPINSFGHTGWTGTSMWIDPSTQTWLIILTSRTHPKPSSSNHLIEDRRAIANIVAASITDVNFSKQRNTTLGELKRGYTGK